MKNSKRFSKNPRAAGATFLKPGQSPKMRDEIPAFRTKNGLLGDRDFDQSCKSDRRRSTAGNCATPHYQNARRAKSLGMVPVLTELAH
jgi:hypothetical protein